MDRRSRISFLNSYMKKTEEFLSALQQRYKAQRTAALTSATHNIQKARTEIQRELNEIYPSSGTENMEVDNDKEQSLASEKKQATSTVDHAQVTKKKRSHGEMIGGDSAYLGHLDPGLSVGEELEKMLSRLSIEEGKSVLEWIIDGMGGAGILQALEAMVKMVGKRLSTALAELFYIMHHGKECIGILKSFVLEIKTENAAENNIVRRRMTDLFTVAEHYVIQQKVDGIVPELHDVIFKDVTEGLLDQCGVTIMQTESLLTLQKLPESAVLATDRLTSIVEQLREMEEEIYKIEIKLMDWKSVFSAYNNVALMTMDNFVGRIEESLDLLWGDLKGKYPKRSRL